MLKQAVGRIIRSAGYSVTRIEADETKTGLVFQQIPGWFTAKEAEALYLLAATSTASRFLEIGHFLGRSTSVFCEAIRDTGHAVEFNSYDLGFTNSEEFIAHYKNVHDTISTAPPEEYERLVFSEGATTTQVAGRNLERFGLRRYVNLISGDFTQLEKGRYGFIFCDAVHDHGEINLMVPHVMAASEDDCIWALHDMTPENIEYVQRIVDAPLIRTADSLGIFRFKRR